MPRMDGTGPLGTGPVGGGMGPCGAGRRKFSGTWFGRGFQRAWCGWQRPRGGRSVWGFGPTPAPFGAGPAAPADEVSALEREAAYLQEELAAVQKRLAELEAASA